MEVNTRWRSASSLSIMKLEKMTTTFLIYPPLFARLGFSIFVSGICHALKNLPFTRDKLTYQGCQMWHSNCVRFVSNRTTLGLFKISFSTFWLIEPKCIETDLKKSQICPIWGQSDPFRMSNYITKRFSQRTSRSGLSGRANAGSDWHLMDQTWDFF